MIFGIPLNTAPSIDTQPATISLAYDDIQAGGNEMVVVNSELPVEIAAIELEIEYNPLSVSMGRPTLSSDAGSMTINYNDNTSGKMKVLMHFTNPFNSAQLIASGNVSLVNIPIIAKEEIVFGDKKQMKITKALFSTSDAARVMVEGVDSPDLLPDDFVLEQNYPNPFNPITTIDFTLKASNVVNLDIYNILGQHVRKLVSKNLPAGAHSVEWDATDNEGRPVATGIYLYRLQIDQKTQSKKMLFLK